MITIAQRLDKAFLYLTSGEIEFALEQICIALDVTAKKRYEANYSSASNYKKLLSEYSWLIELIGLPGLDTETSIFGNYPYLKQGNQEVDKPKLKDLVYEIVRCNLVHGQGLPENFLISDTHIITFSENFIEFPKSFILGLLSIVIFSSTNRSETSSSKATLTICEKNMHLNECWGDEAFMRNDFALHEPIKVDINIQPTKAYPIMLEFVRQTNFVFSINL